MSDYQWPAFAPGEWPKTRWFGESWGAPVCELQLQVDTPVGFLCIECGDSIVQGDRGFLIAYLTTPPEWQPWHKMCFLRTILPPDIIDSLDDHNSR